MHSHHFFSSFYGKSHSCRRNIKLSRQLSLTYAELSGRPVAKKTSPTNPVAILARRPKVGFVHFQYVAHPFSHLIKVESLRAHLVSSLHLLSRLQKDLFHKVPVAQDPFV